MNKRGDTTVWQEIVKAIPAMIIVLILVGAGVKIWNATHPEKFSVEKKDLRRIASEIKDLKDKDVISVPLFTNSNYTTDIVKITQDRRLPGCSKDFCACFEKDGTVICEAFDIDLKVFNDRTDCKVEDIHITKADEQSKNQVNLKRDGCVISYS